MKLSKFKNRGFTLLFAVLIASVLLSVTLAIFSQMYKSLSLSSASKESLAAFYAADSGIECVLYWDLKHEPLTSFSDSIFPNPNNPSGVVNTDIKCNDQDFTAEWKVVDSSISVTTTFDLYFRGGFLPTEGCTKVIVIKTVNFTDGTVNTDIQSRGYNICDSSPRKLERAVRVSY